MEASRLERLGRARLLVVAEGAPPPETTSCLEDWVRLPASDDDVAARVAALAHHAQRHPELPIVNPWGQVTYHGVTVILSPREAVVATVLVEHFAEAVRDHDIIERAWPDGDGTPTALRVHAHRLRKRVEPIGLALKSIRGYGYMLSRAIDA